MAIRIPGTPFEVERPFELAAAALSRFGFKAGSLRRRFPIPLSEQQPRWEIDVVAFSEPMAQPQNASITVHRLGAADSAEALVRNLAISTAPFHLLFDSGGNSFSFWLAELRDQAVNARRIRGNLAPEKLEEELAEYSADLNPRTIRRVKQGLESFHHPAFASVRPLQLSLFTEEVTGPLLVGYFSHALAKLRKRNLNDVQSSKLATQLLAARILADTKVFDEPVDTVRQIGIAARDHSFQRYFDPTLLVRHQRAAEEAFEVLKGISFSSFTPEMLRSIYSAAYPKHISKQRGRFDTPLYLTRRIWENLPVETLAPDQRLTVDMTCGWGSFLISGYERMNELGDMEDRPLRNYLVGNDNDPLTAHLASLALLLSSGRDSWKVEAEDACTWPWLDRHRPNIIVGNPPFASNRKTDENPRGTVRRREELANTFLRRALNRLSPGGLLAMVMPGSFVDGEAGPDTRKLLLETSDVYEIWELPEGVFEEATVRPLVVFARKIEGKSSPSSQPTRIRNLQPQKPCLTGFQLEGTFTRSTLAPDQSRWTKSTKTADHSKVTHVFDYYTILPEQDWKAVRNESVNLSDVAEIINGAIPGTPAKGDYADFSSPRQVAWLEQPSKAMPGEFVLKYTKARKTYPNDFQWPRFENSALFEADKILLTSVKNPRWGCRVNLAIDRRGYFVPHNYYLISPRSSAYSVEVLAAVIRWRVSNAWLLERMFSPWVSASLLKTIPFPINLTDADKATLKRSILLLEKARAEGADDPKADETIDRILRRAYRLPDRAWELLDQAFRWEEVSGVCPSLDRVPLTGADAWKTRGVIEEVDAIAGKVRLWIEGRSESETIAIDERMPGWLLRPGAAFEVTLPRNAIKSRRFAPAHWGKFVPQPYSYLEGDALETEMRRMLTATR